MVNWYNSAELINRSGRVAKKDLIMNADQQTTIEAGGKHVEGGRASICWPRIAWN